jgi:DNA-binding FrmR family transcriptional regulator
MSPSTLTTNRPRLASHAPDVEVLSRLRKATGQLGGVTSMYEDGRYCIDVLDQLSAVTAAVDAVAALILTDYISACMPVARDTTDAQEEITELITAVRRYVRSR